MWQPCDRHIPDRQLGTARNLPPTTGEKNPVPKMDSSLEPGRNNLFNQGREIVKMMSL